MPRSEACRWVYMTAATRREAALIGEALVRERLAACVNILGPISSVYRWKGRLERGREVAFIAKTSAARLPALVARVRALHRYDVPCVVALDIKGGNPAFLRWVRESVRPSRSAARPAGRRG